MGRQNLMPSNPNATIRLSVEALKLVDCGCYDSGGAYWGQRTGTTLYRAVGDDVDGYIVELFADANNRENAKAAFRELAPGAKFYR